jgi:hypothetical protein
MVLVVGAVLFVLRINIRAMESTPVSSGALSEIIAQDKQKKLGAVHAPTVNKLLKKQDAPRTFPRYGGGCLVYEFFLQERERQYLAAGNSCAPRGS